MSMFRDHFSASAATYAAFRPSYPEALFRWLADVSPERRRAWDCCTGNGQAAVGLAPFFHEVVATDVSIAQLTHARPNSRVTYAACSAENSAIAGGTVDLVTIAQALHWLDMPSAFAEVRRVLRPGGVVAAWSYGLLTVSPEVDRVLHRFHQVDLAGWWPPERALVDAGYSGIDFPFPRIAAPGFAMRVGWTLAQLAGYVESWSGTARYAAHLGRNPVPPLVQELEPLWGDAGTIRPIEWPLELFVGRAS